MSLIFVPFFVSFLTFTFSIFLIWQIKKEPVGSAKIFETSKATKEIAFSYLKRQSFLILLLAIFLFILLSWGFSLKIGIGFLAGVAFGWLVIFLGGVVLTQSNLKGAEATKASLEKFFSLAFKGSQALGLLVASLALLAITLFYLLTNDLKVLVAFVFGSSLISIFSRLGGALYNQGVNFMADFFGQVPQNDLQNSVLLPKQEENNVVAGLGTLADLFETSLVIILAAMILGSLIFVGNLAILLPLFLASISLVALALGTFFVSFFRRQSILAALSKGLIAAGFFSVLGFIPLLWQAAVFLSLPFWKIYLSMVIGFILAAILFLVINSWEKAIFLPSIFISLAILIIFWLAGLYGFALYLVAMLSLVGLIVILDIFSSLNDQAFKIAKSFGFDFSFQKSGQPLAKIKKTAKRMVKVLAIFLASLAALVLFFVFSQEILSLGKKIDFFLSDYLVVVGLLLGGFLPYYFLNLGMEAVKKIISKLVEEGKGQFKVREDNPKFDDGRFFNRITQIVLRETVFLVLFSILSPILVGFLLGPKALGCFLIGSIITGFFISTFHNFVWERSKFLEGNFDGKEKLVKKVAENEKETSYFENNVVLAINPMVKIMNIVALLILSFLI
jgi:K(+)-stimulated pyrophosphate-energized sodium pump